MNGVIYARYSSDNQREESIEGQLRECKEFAEKNDNRPNFQKMIKDSEKRAFDVIIVWKLDRFARNRYDSAHYKAMLKKRNVRVLSATEQISPGAEGILLEAVLEGMAEYYSAGYYHIFNKRKIGRTRTAKERNRCTNHKRRNAQTYSYKGANNFLV